MNLIKHHITPSFAVLLLLMAGLTLAQVHETVHLVEDMIVSAGHQEDTPAPDSDHEDCLNCILAFAAADLATSFSDFSRLSVALEIKSTQFHFSSAPTSGFLLRAPPAV